jgi:hypothetical protein
MARAADASGLQVGDDERFQRREWKIQRVAWVVLGLVLLGGLLGAFGGGVAAHATASSAGVPAVLDYDRLVRFSAPTELRVVLDPTAIRPDGVAHLWLPHRYLRHVEVDRVTPEPQRVIGGASGVIYEFVLTPGQAGIISVVVRPTRAGVLAGQLVLADRRGLSFRQFVYP